MKERASIAALAWLAWFSISLYLGALLYRSRTHTVCLFEHEQYGFVIPWALLSLLYGFLIWRSAKHDGAAPALAFGAAVGILAAGVVFFDRYAFWAIDGRPEYTIFLFLGSHLALAWRAWTADRTRFDRRRLAFSLLYAVTAPASPAHSRD